MKKEISKRITKRFQDKREGMVYIAVVLWIFIGILTAYYEADFEHTAAYYLSLTGFLGSYIWGESVRKSENTSIFFKGKNSGREVMIYVVMILWVVLGVWGLISHSDLLSISAYFAALSPFVSAYILGQTYKPVDPASLRPQLAPRNGNGGGFGGTTSFMMHVTNEPGVPQPNLNYSSKEDPHVLKAIEDKKNDPTLPEPDVSEEDMST